MAKNTSTSQTKTKAAAQPQSILNNWQPLTMNDAYQSRPPIQYCVEGVIENPSLNVVYGAPGCLKSFLLADMVECIVGAQDWLPFLPGSPGRPLKVTQSSAVWLDFDNGKRRTLDRFAAIGRALGLPPDASFYYYSMPDPWLDASDKVQISELTTIIQNHGAGIVVIDNLGTISGKADENSGDMVAIFANLRWLAEKTGAAVVVIHHRRKSNGNSGRIGDALRGHSSIEAALDLALLIERDQNSQKVNITATKTRGVDIKSFSAIFTYEHDSSGQLHQARFFGVQSDRSLEIYEIRRAIWDCLENGPLNKGELTTQAKAICGKGDKRIREEIDLMCNDKYILMKVGVNNAQIYTRNHQKTF